MSVWNLEYNLEQTIKAHLESQLPAVEFVTTFEDDKPNLPYCAILALTSSPYIEGLNWSALENRTVTVNVFVRTHANDYTGAQHEAFAVSILDEIMQTDIVATLNTVATTAGTNIVIQNDISFSQLTRNVEDHERYTVCELEIPCYPTTDA